MALRLDWSPDGKRLAYSSGCCKNSSSISIIDLETEQIQPITSSEAFADVPSWSPDGAFLAYLTATDDVDAKGYALNIYSFATGSVTQILNEKVFTGVSWRP
jgi:Tol biopolymer transport system component